MCSAPTCAAITSLLVPSSGSRSPFGLSPSSCFSSAKSGARPALTSSVTTRWASGLRKPVDPGGCGARTDPNPRAPPLPVRPDPGLTSSGRRGLRRKQPRIGDRVGGAGEPVEHSIEHRPGRSDQSGGECVETGFASFSALTTLWIATPVRPTALNRGAGRRVDGLGEYDRGDLRGVRVQQGPAGSAVRPPWR